MECSAHRESSNVMWQKSSFGVRQAALRCAGSFRGFKINGYLESSRAFVGPERNYPMTV